MKKGCVLVALLMFSQVVVLVYGGGPDNPLNENAFEWKGLGWVQMGGTGVNATLPQNVDVLSAPFWSAPTSVVQAFLYVNIIYTEGNASHANATVLMNTVPIGTNLPYSSDYVDDDDGSYWNIYKWDVTSLVDSTGGALYSFNITSDMQGLVGNVLLVVVLTDPSASPKHIIINDGIEVLHNANHTTIFHNAGGPSWNGINHILAVTGGDINEDNLKEEFWQIAWDWLSWRNFGYSDVWNSSGGLFPYFDIYAIGLINWGNFLPLDVNITVGTGDDYIGWEVAIIEAMLRDVYAENQTHPNSEVVQGAVEPVEVAVGSNNDLYSGDETFNVTLHVYGPYTGSVGKLNVTDLPPGNSTTIVFNWDTTGFAPGIYSIRAHADSDDVIPEFDEDNNWCNDTTTLRIMTPPVADADGPYQGKEGTPVTFDGSGSYDLDGTIVSYEWDLDDDGFFDDASGVSPVNVWCDDYDGPIGLNVTDDDGLFNTSTSTAMILNVPPTITFFNRTSFESGCDRVVVEFLTEFTDPGWCDTHTAVWDWGDGSSSPGVLVEENSQPDSTGSVTGKHTYDVRNTYQNFVVTLYVYDDDGGVTSYVYRSVPSPVGGELVSNNVSTVGALVIAVLSVIGISTGIAFKKRKLL